MSAEMRAKVEAMGLTWDDVKAGLVRVLPILEAAAAMTTNPYDDMAVKFLRSLLGE